MEKIRLAVVGLGHRGREMFKNISLTSGVEPVCACDLDSSLFYEPQRNAQALAESMEKVRFYDDFDKMMSDEKFDVLLVETPALCHAEFCARALERNIHVYSDIPSVASLEEADMLWQAQKRSRALLMTGATTMGWGFVHAMQDIYQKGLLGKPYLLEAEYIHDCRSLWEESPWRKPSPGNAQNPAYYCTHGLGPLLSVMEEDLRYVNAFTTGSHVTDIPEANDANIAVYRTESGVMVRQTNSFINNCKTGTHSFRIFGTEGFFEHLAKRGDMPETTAFSSNSMYGAKDYTKLPVSFQPHDSNTSFGHGGADSWMWNSFEKALRAKADKAPCDLRDGLRMTLPGIFAVRSILEGGREQKIRYPWDK